VAAPTICNQLPSNIHFYDSAHRLSRIENCFYATTILAIAPLHVTKRQCSLYFWATICNTVRLMLSDRCPVCLSCLSVPLVYCGQTVERIMMKLDTQVGLGPGHIVLDGDPAPPPKKRRSPQFSAHVCCGQTAGLIKMPLGAKVGLGPDHTVLHGNPAHPSPQRGTSLQFSADVYCG